MGFLIDLFDSKADKLRKQLEKESAEKEAQFLLQRITNSLCDYSHSELKTGTQLASWLIDLSHIAIKTKKSYSVSRFRYTLKIQYHNGKAFASCTSSKL